MKIADFATRGPANKGIKLPLVSPGGGATDYWIEILGIDSDQFREAEHNLLASLAKDIDETAGFAELESKKAELLSSLITGWNLKEKFTKENVEKLLIEAPQIAEAINKAAADRALFFERKSES